MHKIGIDERTHSLICDFVEGNLNENDTRELKQMASESKSIRDLIADTQYSRRLLVMYSRKMTS